MVLFNKPFDELMKRTQPSNSEKMSDYQVKLRKGLEKAKNGEALTTGEEVWLREERISELCLELSIYEAILLD